MQVTETLKEKGEEMMGREGEATKAIEKVTSAAPSSVWLGAAAVSIIGSLTLKLMGRSETANFVGQWAPTFLLIGVYNKLVKVGGSERSHGVFA